MHRGRNVGRGIGRQANNQGAGGNGDINRAPAPGAAQGLMLIEDGGDLRWHGDSIQPHLFRIGHLLALGIEDGDFCLGGGGVLAGDLLQAASGEARR